MSNARSTETPTSGFTEEQRSELAELIAEAVKGGAPPPENQPKDGPQVTDDEWGGWSDRKKQNFITELVDHRLGELARLDKDYQRDAKIAELESKNRTPEPERTPSTWSKIQGFLWGDKDAQ